MDGRFMARRMMTGIFLDENLLKCESKAGAVVFPEHCLRCLS
jgi:hypothetical protein